MAEKIDFKLRKRPDGIYDLNVGADGDMESTGGVETSLLMSFFAERRADASEVAVPFLRRGWWGNAFTPPEGFELGSKLWLLYQARNLPNSARRAEDYVRQAFQWLIETQIFRRINVDAQVVGDTVLINVVLINQGNNVETMQFDLLNQTVTEIANAA